MSTDTVGQFSDRRKAMLDYVRRQADAIAGRSSRTGITNWVVLTAAIAATWSIQSALERLFESSSFGITVLLGFALSTTGVFLAYVVLSPILGPIARSLPERLSESAIVRILRVAVVLLEPGILFLALLAYGFLSSPGELNAYTSLARTVGLWIFGAIISLGVVTLAMNEGFIAFIGLPLPGTTPGWRAHTSKWSVPVMLFFMIAAATCAVIEFVGFVALARTLPVGERLWFVQASLVGTLLIAVGMVLQRTRRNERDLEQLRDLERQLVFSRETDEALAQQVNDCILGQQLGSLVTNRMDRVRALTTPLRERMADSERLEQALANPALNTDERRTLIDKAIDDVSREQREYSKSMRGLVTWLEAASSMNPNGAVRDMIRATVQELKKENSAVGEAFSNYAATMRRLAGTT